MIPHIEVPFLYLGMTRCRDESVFIINFITESVLAQPLPAGFVDSLLRMVKHPGGSPLIQLEQPPPRQPWPLLQPGPCATIGKFNLIVLVYHTSAKLHCELAHQGKSVAPTRQIVRQHN